MAVTPMARLPFIGTLATSVPWPVVTSAFRSLRREVFFNFELHAIDVLDASDGIPAELVRQQRDLRVPAAVKLKRLDTLLSWLRADRLSVTVLEAARKLRPLL